MTRFLQLRLAIGAVGFLAGLYGAYVLLGQGLDNLIATVKWLAGGVILHDAILAPVTIVVCVLGARLLPGAVRRPATVALVVLGSVTIVAIPVLLRLGARPDNPTLLDRDYTGGWLALAAVALAGVAVGTARLVRRRR